MSPDGVIVKLNAVLRAREACSMHPCRHVWLSAHRKLCSELPAGVVQCLIDGPACRLELFREGGSRDAVDRDSH